MPIPEYLYFCDDCETILIKIKNKLICPNCGKEVKVDGL